MRTYVPLDARMTPWLLVLLLCSPALHADKPAAPRASLGKSVFEPKLVTEGTAAQQLENLIQLNERIFCGGEPNSDRAMLELTQLGVRTIVSVDGARPHVELARRYGLRYVHIPIGYDGIDANAGRGLARVAREEQGGIFVHCHHGKHRGPAAAAILCIALGLTDGEGARQILEQAGTSRQYAGLWRDVQAYQPPSNGTPLPELVEVATVDSLAAAMADLDRSWERLRLCRAAGWQDSEKHPDVTPAQESLLLREGFRESARHVELGGDNTSLVQRLRAAEGLAAEIEAALRAGQPQDAERAFQQLERACVECHRRERDGEKQ